MTPRREVRTALVDRPARDDTPAEPGAPISGELRRVLRPLLVMIVLAVPLEIPRLALNAVAADGPIALFMLVAAAAAWRERVRLRLPLAGSYVLIVLGGVIAMTQTIVPTKSAQALVIDIYLFLWFLLLANVLAKDAGARRTVAVAWVWAGVGEALFMSYAHLRFPGRTPRIFGTPTTDAFNRTNGTLFDPNLAGFYLVVSLFVLWAAPKPSHRWTKVVLSIPLLYGIYTTQSITAIATVVGGTIVALTVAFVSRRDVVVASVLFMLAASFVVVALLPENVSERSATVINAIGKTGPFTGSIGRENSSLGGRTQRWAEALQLFGGNLLVGIGPASSAQTLARYQARIGGELHNDYIAGFIERGVVGGIGVLALFVVAGTWAVRVGTKRGLASQGWHPAALTGAMAAIVMTALTLEVLHFRHVWLFLALLIGVGLAEDEAQVPG